nr:hypothetical protein [uncultured Roseibium sp.]
MAGLPDEIKELEGLQVERFHTAVWKIRAALAIIFHGSAQHTDQTPANGHIKPDEGVGASEPFPVGVRMSAFQYPAILDMHFVGEPILFRFRAWDPARPVVDLVHVMDRQAGFLAKRASKRAFAGSGSTDDHDAFHEKSPRFARKAGLYNGPCKNEKTQTHCSMDIFTETFLSDLQTQIDSQGEADELVEYPRPDRRKRRKLRSG